MSWMLQLIDRKIIRVLSALAAKKEHFHIQKLSSSSKVPLSSTFRIVNKLVRLGLVEITTIGKFKIYRLRDDKLEEIRKMVGER